MTHRVTLQLASGAGGVLLSALSGNAALVALSLTGFLLLNSKVVPDRSRWAAICCGAGGLFGGVWGSLVALSAMPGVLQLRGTLVTRGAGRRLYAMCALAQTSLLWWAWGDDTSLMLFTTVVSYLLLSFLYQTSKEVRAVMAAVCLSQIAFMYGQGVAPVLLISVVTALLLPLRLSSQRRKRR